MGADLLRGDFNAPLIDLDGGWTRRRASAAKPLLLSQTASGLTPSFAANINGFGLRPLPAAIVAIERPEAIERSSLRITSPLPSWANSSRCLMSNQLGCFSLFLSRFMRTKTQPPCRRSASSTNLKSPLAKASSGVRSPPVPSNRDPRVGPCRRRIDPSESSLRSRIIQGVVFDLDREPFACWIQRWAARHRPRLEHEIQFKTQIVVQAGRRMLLNDETAPICGDDQSFAT
jgi:hypothetical protein